MRFRSLVVFLLALAVAASALYLRRRPRPAAEDGEQERDIVLAPTREATPPAPPHMAAPARSEVQPTLDRVFDRTLAMDPANRRAFVAGDFNGDGITDLAVAVRPGSGDAVPRLNAELTRCSVQDAAAPAPDAVSKPEPVQVEAGDLLLAVVHGADGGGWRSPDARQCYLVKNAAGSGLQPRPLSGMPAAIRMRVNRTHAGDVMVENRGRGPGLIFWSGARYVRADLKAGGPR